MQVPIIVMTHPLANLALNLDQLNLLITDIIKFVNIYIILFYFSIITVLKYLAYGSLRNESTLILPQLMVKQTYVRYRIVLMYFDQHFLHHVKLELMVAQRLELLLVHLLQFYKPRINLIPW
jgi:hypothetical protein